MARILARFGGYLARIWAQFGTFGAIRGVSARGSCSLAAARGLRGLSDDPSRRLLGRGAVRRSSKRLAQFAACLRGAVALFRRPEVFAGYQTILRDVCSGRGAVWRAAQFMVRVQYNCSLADAGGELLRTFAACHLGARSFTLYHLGGRLIVRALSCGRTSGRSRLTLRAVDRSRRPLWTVAWPFVLQSR